MLVWGRLEGKLPSWVWHRPPLFHRFVQHWENPLAWNTSSVQKSWLFRSPLSLIKRNTAFNSLIHTPKTSIKVNCTSKVFTSLQWHKHGQINFTFSISIKCCWTRHSPLSSTTASATSFFCRFLQCQAQQGSSLTCSFQISSWHELLNLQSQAYSSTWGSLHLLVTYTYTFLIYRMNIVNLLKKIDHRFFLCCSISKKK